MARHRNKKANKDVNTVTPSNSASVPTSKPTAPDGLSLLKRCDFPNCSKLPLTNFICQCQNLTYCSAKHQKNHWNKTHRQVCPIPFTLDENDDAGKFAMTHKKLTPGQLIFEEKPLLVLPLVDPYFMSYNQFTCMMDHACIKDNFIYKPDLNLGPIMCRAKKAACLGCMRLMDVKDVPDYQCTKCQVPMCSDQCEYLESHHRECSIIANLISAKDQKEKEAFKCIHTLYMDIEILRLLLLSSSLGSHDGDYEFILKMSCKPRVETYIKTERYELFLENVQRLVPLCWKFSNENEDLLAEAHAILNSLTFKPSTQSTYKLLFKTQALFRHSCTPNTFHYIKNKRSPDGKLQSLSLVTKACHNINENQYIWMDWTPSPYIPYPLRQKYLKDILNIERCCCFRCQDPSSIQDFTLDLQCLFCKEYTVSPKTLSNFDSSIWWCRKCRQEMPPTIKFALSVCQSELDTIMITDPKEKRVDSLIHFITMRGKWTLNPRHELVLIAWSYIELILRPDLKALRNHDLKTVYSGDELRKFQIMGWYVEEMLRHMQAIRPGIWIDRGILLFHKFYSIFVINSSMFQTQHIQRQEFVDNMFKCLKILQQSIDIFKAYEDCNQFSDLMDEAKATFVFVKANIMDIFQGVDVISVGGNKNRPDGAFLVKRSKTQSE